MRPPKPKPATTDPTLLVVLLCGCLMLALLSLLLGFVVYVAKSETPWLFISASVTFVVCGLCCCGITAGPAWLKAVLSWWSKT